MRVRAAGRRGSPAGRGAQNNMTEIPITLTCADYARIMPLAIGEVKPDNIALTMILGSRGPWPARAEMLRRAVQDPAVQGGEWSMAQYLYRIDKGDRRYAGIPVFPLANFTGARPLHSPGGPIQSAADLAGKRIGMYSYTASGSIWYRHFLRFIGLDPSAIEWWIGDIDTPWSAPMDQNLPPGVKAPPKGRSLADLLVAGELEAIYSPPRPAAYHPRTGPIVACSRTSAWSSERHLKTGDVPPQHLIGAPARGVGGEPPIARSLTDAFSAANDCFTAAQRGFPYATPWLEPQLEDTAAVMERTFTLTGSRRTGRRSTRSRARRPARPDDSPDHDRGILRGLLARRLSEPWRLPGRVPIGTRSWTTGRSCRPDRS